MVIEMGLASEMVAERLGCTAESDCRWVMIHRRAISPIPLQQELDAAKELRAAKKQIALLKIENDFLKKPQHTL